jgi:hypothetical protein
VEGRRPAPREVEEELWKRFRGAQDTFFGARDEAMAAQDSEFAANAEAKEKLLAEAEQLVPVTDVEGAKRAIREIAERWDAIGKVPRDQIRPSRTGCGPSSRPSGASRRRSGVVPTREVRPRRRHGRQAARGDRQGRGRPGPRSLGR